MRRAIIASWLLLLPSLTQASSPSWIFVTEPFAPFSSAADTLDGQSPPQATASPFARIIYRVCQQLQRRCRIEIYPWRRALSLAEQGSVQGIYTVVHNREREQAFYLTPSLIRGRYTLLTRQREAFTYHSPRDLAGRTIAAYGPSGTSSLVETLLPQAPGAGLQLEPDNLRVLKKLEAGRYGTGGVAVINGDVARQLLAAEGIRDLQEVTDLAPIDYAIGLSRKSVTAAEAEAFNQALEALRRSGELTSLIQHGGLTPAP